MVDGWMDGWWLCVGPARSIGLGPQSATPRLVLFSDPRRLSVGDAGQGWIERASASEKTGR